MMKNLDHPNIIRLFDVFYDAQNFYFVSELCVGQNLFEATKARENFTESEVKIIVQQILQALNYCHSNNICHRDIKPANIIIKPESLEVKLIDFGTACQLNPGERMNEVAGTLMFMAPEMMNENRSTIQFD